LNVLLTGAQGFIGRHVQALLLREGHEVIALVRKSTAFEPLHENLAEVIGDIATGAGFEEIPWSKLDCVVHLAASGVKASHRVWSDALAVNVAGTQRLLTKIKTSCPQHPTVFVGCSFYEHLTKQYPALLANPYISTKLSASELAQIWAVDYPGSIVFGTFFQVYGPGDNSGNVLSYAAKEMKAGRPAIFGSGKGLRDWIYITDAAKAVMAALNLNTPGVHDVDIGTGILVDIRSIVEKLAELIGYPRNQLIFDSIRDREDVYATLAAIRLAPDWTPSIDMQTGLLNL
jgi:nucleoside-diphosphate-sugar epimerase